MIAAENDRDRPTGAGAAPGRQDRQPRAGSRRGRRDGRSTKFYEHLTLRPAIKTRTAGEIHFPHATAAQIIARGEFVALSRWLTCARAADAPQLNFGPERPTAPGEIAAEGEDPAETNSDLAAFLGAITDDVQSRATAARDGIRADFAGRINHVRKHVSGFARAAAISALNDARKAALSILNQSVALELAGRKRAAIAAFGKKSRGRKSPPGLRTTPNNEPRVI
jgi:hypothetical protein